VCALYMCLFLSLYVWLVFFLVQAPSAGLCVCVCVCVFKAWLLVPGRQHSRSFCTIRSLTLNAHPLPLPLARQAYQWDAHLRYSPHSRRLPPR
jgi:hypothetical protein